MATGLVPTALKSVCGAQPATPMPHTTAAGQLDQRMNPVIPPSHGSAAHLARGMAKSRAVKSADGYRGDRRRGRADLTSRRRRATVQAVATPGAARSRILGAWPHASMNLGRSAAAIVVVAALVSGW